LLHSLRLWLLHRLGFRFFGGTRQIQRQKPFENLLSVKSTGKSYAAATAASSFLWAMSSQVGRSLYSFVSVRFLSFAAHSASRGSSEVTHGANAVLVRLLHVTRPRAGDAAGNSSVRVFVHSGGLSQRSRNSFNSWRRRRCPLPPGHWQRKRKQLERSLDVVIQSLSRSRFVCQPLWTKVRES